MSYVCVNLSSTLKTLADDHFILTCALATLMVSSYVLTVVSYVMTTVKNSCVSSQGLLLVSRPICSSLGLSLGLV